MPPDSSHLPTATLTALRQRAELLRATREFFHAEGYWEVETPLLSRDVCVDAWIDPLELTIAGWPGRWFLQTSPEFAMKRLLTAGAEAIYQITKSFRAGESGERHNPEFTIVEWYRIGDTHHDQMTVVERLVRAVAADNAGLDTRPHALPAAPFLRLTYDEAFQRFLGTKVIALELAELVAAARPIVNIPAGLEQDRDGLLNLLLAEVVEPGLAELGAVFLYNYPASQSALARVAETNPPVAERFELYLDGVELCNGYHELTDAEELRTRFRRQNELRVLAGKTTLPEDSQLLKAMEVGLPACSGVALGFDRLVMWRLGKQSLSDVIPFPVSRA